MDESYLRLALADKSVSGMALVKRSGRWEVWAHIGANALPDCSSDRLPTFFETLDGAYNFIRGLGYLGCIEVDEAAFDPTCYRWAIYLDADGRWCYRVIDAAGVEVAGGTGLYTWWEADHSARVMLADLREAASDPVFGDEANTKPRVEYS
jgi:hypothetical protein